MRILLTVALIYNNIPKNRQYPHHNTQHRYIHMRSMLKKKIEGGQRKNSQVISVLFVGNERQEVMVREK